jgi:hypothetical protein
MPTTHCKCGEQLHYSTDKVGLIARCRCGRPVRLPEPKPQRKHKAQDELFDEERRAANIRRQVLAVLLVLVLTIGGVLLVQMVATSPSKQRNQATPAADAEP